MQINTSWRGGSQPWIWTAVEGTFYAHGDTPRQAMLAVARLIVASEGPPERGKLNPTERQLANAWRAYRALAGLDMRFPPSDVDWLPSGMLA